MSARFDVVEAVYNFEYGYEVEVALCQLLTEMLPNKFGVCRGFVVNKKGEKAGDDIVIYDKLNFPLIRQLSINDFSLKQQVPVEAVYACIECKNSIADAVTLAKSLDQVRSLKKVLFTRDLKANPSYVIDGPTYNGKVREDWPRQEPQHMNQPYVIVFARNWGTDLGLNVPNDQCAPDLMVLGADHLATQHANLGPDGIKGALFFDSKNHASLMVEEVKGNAFGLSLLILFQVLSTIELEQIDWSEVLNSEFFTNLEK